MEENLIKIRAERMEEQQDNEIKYLSLEENLH
jgi:hypothetical protein